MADELGAAAGASALLAQCGCRGPTTTNTTVAIGTTTVASMAADLAVPGGISVRRHKSAPATTTTQSASRNSSQGSLESVPVPRPCQSAIGQQAYASQCTPRQARREMRARSRLVITRASSRSNAMVPRLSQNVRYDEMNGTTIVAGLIATNVSSTVVSTWITTNTMTSSEMLRCRPAVITRGQRGDDSLDTPATPRATVAVSRSSAITPVARVVYQSGLGPARPAAARWRTPSAARPSPPGGLAARGTDQDPPEETTA